MQELRVPEVGESIHEVQVGPWHVQEGQWADRDQTLVEIETDKATVDLAAPAAGVLREIVKRQGEPAAVGEILGYLEPQAAPAERAAEPQSAAPSAPAVVEPPRVMPAAERLLTEHRLRADQVEATGPGGRLLKEDVRRHIEPAQLEAGAAEAKQAAARAKEAPPAQRAAPPDSGRQEEAVPMSLLRRRIAERLVEAQQQAALLTTFNEIDLRRVIDLRKRHRDAFQAKYGVKLGFMSFFVKAVVESLKSHPELNAEVRGENIVYRNYYDIGIAIGGGKGLVVPVLQNAERMSFAEIERAIDDFVGRAAVNKLAPEEITGGTFTITNGGIYGSLLSTPIINPPQSGILGMHAIEERPVARGGEVVIRPMMYVALTYDHRVVDGREAVGFLVRVKEIIEDPARMLLEV